MGELAPKVDRLDAIRAAREKMIVRLMPHTQKQCAPGSILSAETFA
jgi:hypothetical protein